MDRMIIKNIEAKGRHGCFAHERDTDGIFKVSLDIFLNLSKAGLSDNLSDTIDYPSVIGSVLGIVGGSSVRLIENLAEKISEELLAKFCLIEEISVEVEKCEIDCNLRTEKVSVKIHRIRG